MARESFPPKFLTKLIGRFLPFSLIDEPNQMKLGAFLNHLPAELEIPIMGFESSLKENWGDLHLGFHPGSGAFKSSPFEDHLWKEVFSLLDEWDGRLESYGVSQIVLEFDVGSCPDWPPLPNVFFLLQKGGKDPFEFLSKMSQRLCPGFSLNALHKYMQDPTSVAFMLARSPKCLRITTSGIKPENADSLIKHNLLEKYTRLFKTLQRNGSFPFPHSIRIVLEITHEQALFPKIEICVGKPGFPQGVPRPVLEHFANCGLFSQEKKSALLSYAGLHAEPFFDLPSDFSRLFYKKIHHLKLTVDSNQDVVLKAYLSVECEKIVE